MLDKSAIEAVEAATDTIGMAVEESQIYRDLMRLKPDSLTPNGWAVKSGVSRAVWADMRRHGNPSRRTLEKLLSAVGSSLAEFEALRVGEQPLEAARKWSAALGDVRADQWAGAPIPPLPLLKTILVGEWDPRNPGIELIHLHAAETIDRLPRPPSLVGDSEAYAITIVGDAMWPRFRPGRCLAISPNAPVAIGDDVLVQLADPSDQEEKDGATKILIKELMRKAATYVELRQFNPDRTFRVARDEIAAIHKVVGELI